MDLLKASFKEVSTAVKQKKISAREVAEFFLNRAEKHNIQLNAFSYINKNVLHEADLLDQKISRGESVGPLAGVVFGIKDMLCTKGLPSTAGSKILQGFAPPYDATVVERLKNAGALVLGKTNQDEFAMGSSNETSFYGPCKNPWKADCVPGGSSGGSASAQASRLVMGTIGTDTGGSIRQPASFCGVVGLKPTYGRVSRFGIIAYASSLDQAGPITSTVDDTALTLEIISGYDEKDGTSSSQQVQNWSEITADHAVSKIKNLKIGLLKESSCFSVHADVEKTFLNAQEELKKMGAEFVEISVPLIEYAVPIYYLVSASEASSNLSRYDGIRYGYRAQFSDLAGVDLHEFYSRTRSEGFGSEVKRRIMLGTYCLSAGYYDAHYKKASQARRLLKNQYEEVFKKCDIILSPVTTTPAFKIGEKAQDPLKMYMNDVFTTATNLAGLAGMSVPFGFSAEGLPIGVQLTGGHFQEATMINVAKALESVYQYKGKTPHVY